MMTKRDNGDHRTISTRHIVFFVIAAAAPLTAVLGGSPVAFAYGNGPGVPFVYLLVGLLYLLFSAGFTAMSPYVGGTAGFYAYVTLGLGPGIGASVAAVAIATYQAIALGAYGLFGVFAVQASFSVLGWSPPWWVLTLPVALAVHLCGRRAVTFSGNLLALCMAGEVAILLALGIVILMHHEGALAIVPPATVFGPGLGVAIVFVVASFIGFEATVIFGEETDDPARVIPRATAIAVLAIALFYGFSTWTIMLHYGPDAIKVAAETDPANLYLTPIRLLLGGLALGIAQGLLLISVFACILSFHATIARYLAGLAHERLCDARLGLLHPVHGSPHHAGSAQTLASVVMVIVAAGLGLDPYSQVFAWAGAFASLGILAMQLITMLAVIRFFHARALPVGWWKSKAAPMLAAAGLLAALILSTLNLGLIAGTKSAAVFLLPGLLVVVAAGGAVGFRRRRRHADLVSPDVQSQHLVERVDDEPVRA